MILYTLIGCLCHACNLLDNGKVMWRNHCCNTLFQSADGCVVWQIELIINKDPGFSKRVGECLSILTKQEGPELLELEESSSTLILHLWGAVSYVLCPKPRCSSVCDLTFHWERISFLLLLLETACALELESHLARWEVRRAKDHSVSQSPCPHARWCPSSPVLLVGLWVLPFRNKMSGWKVT